MPNLANDISREQINAKLVLNDTIEVQLGFEILDDILTRLPYLYSDELADLYNLCARSSSASIRKQIARKDNLPEALINLLLSDSNADVVKQIINEVDNRKFINDEQIQYAFSFKNNDIDSEIARNIEEFTNCNQELLINHLSDHEDPEIRNELAGNKQIPLKIRNKLKKDIDPIVVSSANGKNSRW